MKITLQREAIAIIAAITMTLGASAQNNDPQNIDSQIDSTLHISKVVVTGTRNEVDIRHLPLSVSIVDREQIEGSYQQSLLPILTEQVPSLFTTARGVMGYGVSTGASGGITLRGVGGSPTTGVLILIDGHPQYMGLMGHSLADAYQSMMAERVEVVRGPASVLYGSNAMGGVINILTTQPTNNSLDNSANVSYGSYNTLTSELSSRYRNNALTAVVTGSYNRSDGHRENMEFEQYGGYAKIGYEFSPRWSIFTDVNLTHFNASNPGTIGNPIFDNDSKITRGVASLSLDNRYDKSSGALKLYYNWGRHNIDDGYYTGGEPQEYLFNSKDKMFGVTYYQSASLFSGNRVTIGVDYQQFGGIAWNAYNDGSTVNTADSSESAVAGYVDLRQEVGSTITLDAALRLDHHSVTGNNWIPQLGASIRATQSGEVKLIASRGFRNPTIKELYMFVSQNPDLLPESLWNYEVSWSQRLLAGRLSYEANIFYINGDNMIQTVMVDGRATNMNSGAVENWGAELSASYALMRQLNISVNYSWLHMENPVVASPEHKLYIGLGYHKQRWSATTGIQYVNGLYTSVTDPISQESFTLWNIRASYRVSKWAELYAKGENLLDQEYQINSGFPMAGATATIGIKLTL
ncbi:MAG: TonB-dependent receptor [Rikenellaceae bacterium]